MTLDQQLTMLEEIAADFQKNGKLIHPSDLVTVARNFYARGYDRGYDDAVLDRQICRGY